MRRSVGLFVLLFVSSIGSLASTTLPLKAHDTVWVVNRDTQGWLMVFDAATGAPRIEAPIVSGLGAHDVAISNPARKAFVMNELENTVAVFSTSTLERLATIPLGPRPHHAKVSANGRWIYVGLFGTNRIAVIDAKSLEVVEYVSGTGPAPLQAHAPRPSHDAQLIFVPHEVGNLVTKLSSAGDLLASLRPGDTDLGQPTEVLPTLDGETLYVAMRNEGKIKKVAVDSFTWNRDDFVSVGVQPESLILTPGERTLVFSLRGSPARVGFVNTEDFTFDGTLDIGGTGTNGDLAIPSPDGRFVYATFDAGTTAVGGIAKIDVTTREVWTWPYPIEGRPHGLAYSTVKLRTEEQPR